MKEISQLHQDKVQIVDQNQVKKTNKHLGTWRLQLGHKVWEINKKTGEIKEATYEQQTVNFKDAEKGLRSVNRKLNVKDGFVYVPALNKKNAIKRLRKLGYSYDL